MSLWPRRDRHDKPHANREHERLRTLDVAARVGAAAEQLERAVARLEPTLRNVADRDKDKGAR